MKSIIILCLISLVALMGCSSTPKPDTTLFDAEKSCMKSGLKEYEYRDEHRYINIECATHDPD